MAGGLDPSRQQYLDFIARCEQTFTPFAPIELPDFFVGRQKEIEVLIRELGAAGRHVAIYGDRGVGKSSLALLCYFFAGRDEEHTHIIRCTRGSTYQTIFADVLRQAHITHVPATRETSSRRTAAAKGRFLEFSRSSDVVSSERLIDGSFDVSPAMLAEVFQEVNGLIILDEYDRVQDSETNVRLAETLKHFSDAKTRAKIVVVGVADSISSLIGQHQSLTRCLAEIRLERMSRDELMDIILRGEQRLGVHFDDDVKDRVVGLSDGFAHYTHLICRHALLACAHRIDRWENLNINRRDYELGLTDAIKGTELNLREDYQRAIIPQKGKTQGFQDAIWALALSDDIEVHVKSIAENMSALAGKAVKTQQINYYLGKLRPGARSSILQRVREGYYKFRDPLMRAFVRLQLEEYNIRHKSGQLQFNFMKAGRPTTAQGWSPIRPAGR